MLIETVLFRDANEMSLVDEKSATVHRSGQVGTVTDFDFFLSGILSGPIGVLLR